MSEKIQLSDEVMDAIAGGNVSYQGKEVAEFDYDMEGPKVTLQDGSKVRLEWTDEIKSWLRKGNRSLFATFNEIENHLFPLEDYIKPGNGIRG